MSYSGRAIPTLTISPPFPRFLGQQWKRRRAGSWIFCIQPRDPPPSGVFSKFVFVADNRQPSSQNGYCSPNNLFIKKIYTMKMNFENHRQEVERVTESEIVPNWHVFVSESARLCIHFRPRN